MLAPKTYTGYDREGQMVCRVTAQNASDYLNPEEVKRAIDNIETVAKDAFNKLSGALVNVAPDADEAVIIQGTKITGTIEDVCSAIKTVPGSIVDSISSIYPESISAHDRLQTQANESAYNYVRSVNDVVSVR